VMYTMECAAPKYIASKKDLLSYAKRHRKVV
jgi:hypothetical protein